MSAYLRHIFTALVLTLCAASAQAQDIRIQQLERQLQERDKVVTELLERVEALERRIGVGRPETGTAGHSKDNAPPHAGTHVADGSQRAPGAVVVDEGAAERALERALTLEGALLLPSGVLEIEPALTYARREDRAPRLVTSASGVVAGETEINANSLTADVAVRLGLPWDSQLELGLPYRWREIESVTSVGFAPTDAAHRSGTGLGDVRVGLATTLLRENLWRPDLVGRITWDTDSGKTQDNGVPLGGGFHELRGSLTALKRQDPLVFVGGLSYEYTFENDQIRPGPVLSANFGSFLALSPETSLRFQLFGSYEDDTKVMGQEISGSDRTVGTFVVGGSTFLARGILLNLALGIGLTNDADDFSITLSLPIRFGKRLY